MTASPVVCGRLAAGLAGVSVGTLVAIDETGIRRVDRETALTGGGAEEVMFSARMGVDDSSARATAGSGTVSPPRIPPEEDIGKLPAGAEGARGADGPIGLVVRAVSDIMGEAKEISLSVSRGLAAGSSSVGGVAGSGEMSGGATGGGKNSFSGGAAGGSASSLGTGSGVGISSWREGAVAGSLGAIAPGAVGPIKGIGAERLTGALGGLATGVGLARPINGSALGLIDSGSATWLVRAMILERIPPSGDVRVEGGRGGITGRARVMPIDLGRFVVVRRGGGGSGVVAGRVLMEVRGSMSGAAGGGVGGSGPVEGFGPTGLRTASGAVLGRVTTTGRGSRIGTGVAGAFKGTCGAAMDADFLSGEAGIDAGDAAVNLDIGTDTVAVGAGLGGGGGRLGICSSTSLRGSHFSVSTSRASSVRIRSPSAIRWRIFCSV